MPLVLPSTALEAPALGMVNRPPVGVSLRLNPYHWARPFISSCILVEAISGVRFTVDLVTRNSYASYGAQYIIQTEVLGTPIIYFTNATGSEAMLEYDRFETYLTSGLSDSHSFLFINFYWPGGDFSRHFICGPNINWAMGTQGSGRRNLVQGTTTDLYATGINGLNTPLSNVMISRGPAIANNLGGYPVEIAQCDGAGLFFNEGNFPDYTDNINYTSLEGITCAATNTAGIGCLRNSSTTVRSRGAGAGFSVLIHFENINRGPLQAKSARALILSDPWKLFVRA